MKREERLLDFVLFILCDYEELLNPVNYFFNQNAKGDPFSKDYKPIISDYLDYVFEHIEPLPISLIEVGNAYTDDSQKIDQLLKSEEKNILLNYLNDNFYHGFPDAGMNGVLYGGNLSLGITKEELENYFERYQIFKCANDRVYISFFVQLFNDIDLAAYKFEKEANLIEKFKNLYNDLEPEFAEKLKEKKKTYYTNKLFNSFEKGDFQIELVFENIDKKFFFLDYDQSLVNQLKILSNDFDNYSFEYKLDLNSTIIHSSLQFLNYQYYGIEPENSKDGQQKKIKLKNELDDFKKKNSNLISFLSKKGFTDRETNILINLLHLNRFSVLKIPYYQFNKQVSQFHILFSFYLLDFFDEKLESIKDFESLISDITSYNINSAEQFRKYYKNISSAKNLKHYPFRSINKTANKIQDALTIDREKLKKISNSMY